jgi:hypothetical protein
LCQREGRKREVDTNGTGCADWGEVDTSDVQIGQKLTLILDDVKSEK